MFVFSGKMIFGDCPGSCYRFFFKTITFCAANSETIALNAKKIKTMTTSASRWPKRLFSARFWPKRTFRPGFDRSKARLGRRGGVGGGPAENRSFGPRTAEVGSFRPACGRRALRPRVDRRARDKARQAVSFLWLLALCFLLSFSFFSVTSQARADLHHLAPIFTSKTQNR